MKMAELLPLKVYQSHEGDYDGHGAVMLSGELPVDRSFVCMGGGGGDKTEIHESEKLIQIH